MRRILGIILTTLLLSSIVACGSGESDVETATDPTPSATDEPTSSTGDGPVDFTEVALLSETASGGTVAEQATPIADGRAAKLFAEQLGSASFRKQFIDEVEGADVPAGQVLAAAVVSIGCDVPPGVSVTRTDGVLSIIALKVTSPHPECYAAVTTVALVLVDQALFN